MLDPLFALFRRILAAIGRGFGLLTAWLVWPLLAVHGWYRQRNWLIKGPLILLVLLIVAFYAVFFWRTQFWYGFDPKFVQAYGFADRKEPAGQPLPAAPAAAQTPPGQTASGRAAAGQGNNAQGNACQNSAIVTIAADLTDQNVNQNIWISSTLAYKLGFFGIDWDHTPFFDNKASFQRGVNQVVRRVAIELADNLGRARGTSGINNDLQDARGNIQFDEGTWYFGFSPFGFKTPTPSYYRTAVRSWRKFNADLGLCNAVFDARADNLVQLLDRMANDLGATSDILRRRSEDYNAGWFDTRADDRFWFAYGQLYAQYAILEAVRADFLNVVRERNLTAVWSGMSQQFQSALRIQPLIISNGAEDGFIMPNHLATMGFYILRVRSNMVELRSVLDR